MITWTNDFVQKYESPWSLLSKVSTVNAANGYEILRYVFRKASNTRTTINYKYGIFISPRFDLNIMQSIMGLNIEEMCKEASKDLMKPFFTVRYGRLGMEETYYRIFFSTNLKYCPECIRNGYHALFHQLSFLDKCLIHDIELIEKCPSCGGNIPYTYYLKSTQYGYMCECSHRLYEEDIIKSIQTWRGYRINSIPNLFHKFENQYAYYISINTLEGITNHIYQDGKKILRDMAFSSLNERKIPYSSISQSAITFHNISVYDRSEVIPKLLYTEALKVVKHHLKKLYKVKSSNLKHYNHKVKSTYVYYLTRVFSKESVYREIRKTEDTYDIFSFAYFLWMREAEARFFDFFNYDIFVRRRKRIYGDNHIDSIISTLVSGIFHCDSINYDSINLYSNIILRIAIILLLDRYDQWISLLTECQKDYECKLDLIINNESLKPKFNYKTEFLLIINGENYKCYTINDI